MKECKCSSGKLFLTILLTALVASGVTYFLMKPSVDSTTTTEEGSSDGTTTATIEVVSEPQVTTGTLEVLSEESEDTE